MRKQTNLFLLYILVCTWLNSLLVLSMPTHLMAFDKNEEKKVLIDSIKIVPSTILNDEINSELKLKDSIKNELILEVEKYILNNFPKADREISSSIVENGLDHEVDILFMMAQTQIETSFGTAGAGRKTSRRSLFGVAVRKYNTYDAAIRDYIAILKKSYLTKGRNEQHLMRKYTTTKGARYAGNPNYEVELRNAYSKINKKTNIKLLQEKYRKTENV